MSFYDMHVHSDFSHDGQNKMEEMCAQAAELGMLGLAFTDHYDVHESVRLDHIEQSVRKAEILEKWYEGKLKVLRGVEIGDGVYQKKAWDEAVSKFPFDVVLGSVHTILTGSGIVPGYSGYRCLESFDDHQIQLFLTNYYQNVLHMAQEMDFDVLTHLTLPLRYLNGYLHRNVTLERQAAIIEQVLKTVISREIALEINTSGLNTGWGELMPTREILSLYYSLGGRRITLGSDAHCSDSLGAGLQKGAEVAKQIGFSDYCYYQNRAAVKVPLA